ncbi:unnamed protein product [Lymnaea stagnalis]|uniref:Uncharacterized protein n=1 Tax=Lymnaea stagnalis TaxID=6523 RepID=A0AAV2IE05_LYMST
MAKRYADNAANRRLGRLGMSVGGIYRQRSYGLIRFSSSFKRYKSTLKKYSQESGQRYRKSVYKSSYPKTQRRTKLYADNATNRRLGRVGMLSGGVFRQRSLGFKSFKFSCRVRVYKDTPKNRQLGRVGMLY